MNVPSYNVGDKSTAKNRYRLPGIEHGGIAQLSILETALWPLKGGRIPNANFQTVYGFQKERDRQEAKVSVYAPLGLESIDEFVLWGLLGLSLSHKQPDPMFMATPYWIIKQLGMSIGGFQYDQLRASLERLAVVAYQNTAFYNPLTQEHERTTFHFFSSYLPTKGRGAEVDADRAWRVEWSPTFFRMCQATGGTLLFDLDLYRTLTPAARRLFLKLKDRFWRSKRVFLNVDDLTIYGLGYAAERPLKKRKFDLTNCIRELLDCGIIELGRGQTDPKNLFLKRGKGLYVVQFFEGPYFRQPHAERTLSQMRAIADDPLYQPLSAIGVDEAGIRRLFKQSSRGLIQKWIKITDAAMHERPHGFPGFKVSPAAFLMDAVANNRMPPDWIYEHEKKQAHDRWEADRNVRTSDEALLRKDYDAERSKSLREFVQSKEGSGHFAQYLETFLDFYRTVEPDHFREAAAKAAAGKVEREHFQFPDFEVWLLERTNAGLV